MTGRTFDLTQAEAALPMLRDLLPRVREARRELVEASERITDAVAIDGGGVEGSGWFRAQEALRADLTTLADEGIVLRDAEMGLVDFPAERNGQRVLLCWHLGEDHVAFFHEEHAGYSTRRPW